MPFVTLVTGFVLALAVAGFLTGTLRDLAHRYRWVDQPDGERKLHEVATPTLGGIAMAVGFIAGAVFLFASGDHLPFAVSLPPLGLWIGAALMLGVGVIDDIVGVGFKAKFFFQVCVAYLLLVAGYRVDGGMLWAGIDPFQEAMVTIPLTLLWIVGVINAVNLLDGLDGLAAGVVMVAFVAFAALFGLHGDVGSVVFAVAMVGAILGFLIYNFNPASIFMGDSGSLFLGYMIAAYSLQGLGNIEATPMLVLLAPVVALAVPITDTGLAIFRRLLSAKAIFAPDCDHIHHRLLQRLTQRQTVLALYGISLWCGLSALMMTMGPPLVGYAVLATTVVAMFAGLRLLGYLQVRATYRLWRQRLRAEPPPGESAPASEIQEVHGYSGDGARGEEEVVLEHKFSHLESS